MFNPYNYIRTNVNQARRAWREWREQSRLLASNAELTKAKARKIKNRIDVSRREFIVAVGKTGMIATASALLAGTGLYAIVRGKEQNDVLFPTFDLYKEDFPFPFIYLENILKDGTVTEEEIGRVVANHQGVGGLYALLAFGLVKRAREKGEMSERYAEFLDLSARMIKEGKISFQSTTIEEGNAIDFLYRIEKKAFCYDPDILRKPQNIRITESSIIHELTHAFQDVHRRAIRWSQFEAEAHLAQSDFLFHVQPDLLHVTHWLQLYQIPEGFKYKFMFPRTTVSYAAGLSGDDSGLNKLIEQARGNYLLIRTLQGSVDPRDLAIRQRRISFISTPEAAYRELVESIEAAGPIAQKKPLREQIACGSGGQAAGRLSTCYPASEIIDYGTRVQLLIMYLWGKGEYGEARKAANDYLLNRWQDAKHNLLDLPGMDVEMSLTGIMGIQ